MWYEWAVNVALFSDWMTTEMSYIGRWEIFLYWAARRSSGWKRHSGTQRCYQTAEQWISARSRRVHLHWRTRSRPRRRCGTSRPELEGCHHGTHIPVVPCHLSVTPARSSSPWSLACLEDLLAHNVTFQIYRYQEGLFKTSASLGK